MIAAREAAFPSAGESFSHFANATSAVSEDMADLFRTMVEGRPPAAGRIGLPNIYADISRLQKQSASCKRSGWRECRHGRSGDTDTAG